MHPAFSQRRPRRRKLLRPRRLPHRLCRCRRRRGWRRSCSRKTSEPARASRHQLPTQAAADRSVFGVSPRHFLTGRLCTHPYCGTNRLTLQERYDIVRSIGEECIQARLTSCCFSDAPILNFLHNNHLPSSAGSAVSCQIGTAPATSRHPTPLPSMALERHLPLARRTKNFGTS